jgi:hypothetical protein
MARSSVRLSSVFKQMIALSFSVFVVAASSTGASAGFLDELFGGSDPAPQAAGPGRPAKRSYAAPAREKADRVRSEVHFMPTSVARAKERPEHRKSTTVAKSEDTGSSVGSKPMTIALCAPEATVAGAPAATLLAYDKTLRNGDIMVTESGVQVFRGHSGCPHDARDFIALSSANMPKGKRSMLLAIEEAMKRPSGYLVTAKFEKR